MLRMFMLNMSAKPATASAATESQNDRDSPNTTLAAPKMATTISSVLPALPPIGPARQQDARAERPDCRRTAEDPEANRSRVEDALCEERQERHGTAEEDCEEVERDRAEQHGRTPDKSRPGKQCLTTRGGRLHEAVLRALAHREDADE